MAEAIEEFETALRESLKKFFDADMANEATRLLMLDAIKNVVDEQVGRNLKKFNLEVYTRKEGGSVIFGVREKA